MPPYNLTMQNANLTRHLAAWNLAADALARERVERLRTMTDEDTRHAVAQLFSDTIRAETGGGFKTSGLAEQQRLFRRLR